MKTKRIVSMLLALIMTFVLATASGAEMESARDIYDVISGGIGCCADYLGNELNSLHEGGGVTYGCEWYLISLVRGGKDVDEAIRDEYYQSVADTVSGWTEDTKPTDIERTALALAVLGQDITDVNGVDLSALICNSPRLTEGSNELAYALLAMDASGAEVPDTAIWSREAMVQELLNFRTADGSFGLYDAESGDVDVTAVCVQALAPYRTDEAVAAAVDGAVDFLRGAISESYDYSGNSNTTAQVLLALAALGVDVTDPGSGFGDGDINIVTALDAYRNTDGGGYFYGDSVNTLATLQVMQAYDAYRKMHLEGISYWDFTVEGADYDDTASGEDTQPDIQPAEPADVYVNIASDGIFVTRKDGGYMAQASVTVTDLDANGKLTVDEALWAAHEAYYDGGAEAGYASYNSAYGLSLAILWGCGSIDTPASAGYWLNNASCWSLEDEVSEGDYLTAFNYCDTATWSDAYSYFTQNELSVTAGSGAALELRYLSGYDAENGYASVFSPCPDAKITVLGDGEYESLTTDASGTATISFEQAGTYYVMACKDNDAIVPAVCKITVTAGSTGDSDGSDGSDSSGSSGSSGGSGGSGGVAVYTVKFHADGGTAIHSERVTRNDCLTQPATPTKDGYTFGGWYTDKALENPYDFETKVTKGFTLYAKWVKIEEETDNALDVGTVFDETTFADISPDSWYYDGVKFVCTNNLMQGTGTDFEPDGKMTRAMLITVLWRLEKQPAADGNVAFDDVMPGEWYSDAICWAASENIISGISQEHFGTDEAITREQLATILYRYTRGNQDDAVAGEGADISAYSDGDAVSAYAVAAVKWAVGAGVIQGTGDNEILPGGFATRAQVATMLMRFCGVSDR